MCVVCGRYRWVMAAGSERPLNEVKFLTVAEVASVMRVSKMTVYRLVHSGHLPHDPGGQVLPGSGASSSRVPPRILRGGGIGIAGAGRFPSDYRLGARAGRLGRRRSCGPRRPAPSEEK